MRIIAGTARHLPLKTPKGMDTRPTTDRIKETLFNILQPGLYDCNFLDLFSGSGAIGLEAVSRGARMATFVDNSREAAFCIRENIAFTKLQDNCKLLETDVRTALQRLEGEASFDYIFLDPPYKKELYYDILLALSKASFVTGDTIIIIETPVTNTFDYLEELGFSQVRYKKYKTNAHLFIRRLTGEDYDTSNLSGKL